MKILLLKRFHAFAPALFTVLFLMVSIFAQVRYDAVQNEHFNLREPIHKFVLPAPIVKHFAFGFQNILADYYWVTAIQDFSKWDRQDFYYPEYFRIISSLDPKFEYPYIFAALTVPSKGNVDSLPQLSVIAKSGMDALPLNWEIPFYVGIQYHVIGKSYEKATEYLAIATKIPGSPEVTRTVYGLYLLHSTSEYQRTRALFSAIYETSDNEETKRIAKDRIALLDFIEMVDQASVSYKKKYEQFPDSLETLAKKGYLDIPLELVKRFQVQIDPISGKATFK